MNSVDQMLQRPFDLSGAHILVAGAGGGIGAAAAQICAEQGARITLVDRVEEAMVREKCGPVCANMSFHRVDTASREEVDRLAQTVGPVSALIDATGISPLDDWMAEDWDMAFDQVIGVNLRGPINLARAFMPDMIATGHGRIVLTGSVAGRMGGIKSGPHYAASKGGIQALTRWLAQKGIRRNVLVNAVAPGSIDTPMAAAMQIDPTIYPQGRAGRPREIGAVMAFLCSPGAGFLSGTVIDVNGGTYFG